MYNQFLPKSEPFWLKCPNFSNFLVCLIGRKGGALIWKEIQFLFQFQALIFGEFSKLLPWNYRYYVKAPDCSKKLGKRLGILLKMAVILRVIDSRLGQFMLLIEKYAHSLFG